MEPKDALDRSPQRKRHFFRGALLPGATSTVATCLFPHFCNESVIFYNVSNICKCGF